METAYDLIVIGAGPGGYVSAVRGAQYGMKVAVVEKDALGGTCLNRGCIPTKTLLHTAGLCRELREADAIGISVGDVKIDLDRIYQRKREVTGKLRDGIGFLFESNHIDLIPGCAQIIAPGKVKVSKGDETCILKAKNILIASGSIPARPPIPGLELPGVITSDDLLGDAPPSFKSLVIIGGGVIGVEFATLLHDFGLEITVIEAMNRILPTMDREISQNLSMLLKKRGVALYTSAMVQRIETCGDGLCCHFTQKEKETAVNAQAVLVAIGRRANVRDLFAQGMQVGQNRGILVDEAFQTSIQGIYAIGDVVDGGIQLAHVASAQGCCAVAHMVGRPAPIDLKTVPACIYTSPEIASVGITADQAKEQGIPVKTGKFMLSGNGKSIIENQDRSFIKLVFHEDTQVLLGAQLMCARATDLISELATAVANSLTLEQLSQVIRPHPTYTEAVTEAVEDALGRAIHIAPRV
ncbi:dihydrolipoyl dehydrogenase [Anaerotruncus rubiinfantis]|uniref:dihydrolipoyl dehydrogenase n=1 Tax=Anaerotruncus rubiinfantis TaxID=1720200 RepID=UPI0034A3121F